MTFFGDAYYCMRWKQSKIFSLNYLCTLISQQEVLFSFLFLSLFFFCLIKKKGSAQMAPSTHILCYL